MAQIDWTYDAIRDALLEHPEGLPLERLEAAVERALERDYAAPLFTAALELVTAEEAGLRVYRHDNPARCWYVLTPEDDA